MVKIVWTELSLIDLEEIFNYISQNSIRYAQITTKKVYQRVQYISDNPNIGRMVPEFENPYIRELIEGNYRIIYRIINEFQVDILRIHHGSKLLTKRSIE